MTIFIYNFDNYLKVMMRLANKNGPLLQVILDNSRLKLICTIEKKCLRKNPDRYSLFTILITPPCFRIYE